MPQTLEELGIPAPVAAPLAKLRDELQAAAGNNLAGLVVYGGLARGRYYAGRSDVNLLVLLADVSVASLAAVASPLSRAWRALRVEPFLLRPDEIAHAATAFPTKFLDIQKHHIVLIGEDPFATLRVPRENVRLRIEQELRNLELRLRRRFLNIAQSPAEQVDVLVGLARPLAIELDALLSFASREPPADDGTAAILAAAALAFNLDREALAQLAALRQTPETEVEATPLYGRVLQVIGRAIQVVEKMKEPPS